MTIGYILDDSLDRADGVQQAVLTIGEYMRKQGHDVHYIVAQTIRSDIPNVHSVGTYWQLQFNGNSVRTPKPASKNAITHLFQTVSFDVLHVQMPYSPLLAGRVLSYAPDHIPVFSTFHILPYNSMSSFGTKMLGIVQKRRLKSFAERYAVSNPALQFMQQAFDCKGSVLPNPVDWEFFHGARPVASDTKKHVVFVGRFEERKGVSELVRAYAGLSNELKSASKLIMCGKGPLHEEVSQLAHDLHVSIELPGFVTEAQKAAYLAGATIAVFPSISGESFGIVLVEAMSAGAEVTLGGNNPGYSSVLGAWPESLFDPKDTERFTKTLERFLTDAKLRDRVGSLQHSAAKLYDIKEVGRRLESDYLRYLEAATGVRP